MDKTGKKKAAKGATLYSNRKRTEKKTPLEEDALKRVQKRISKIKIDPSLPTIQPIKDETYKTKVIEFLALHGIEVTSYKERYITRRVKVRLGRLRLDSYKEYLTYLQKNPQEIHQVKESLSINVTRFFRNRDTFDLIAEKIFPEILNKSSKSGQTDLNIWSAGCAVGAEPYTIAIVAANTIASKMKVSILATDVKTELISAARNGVYNEQYLAEMEKTEVQNHFLKIDEENFEIAKSTKNLVNFRQHDLMKDPYPGNLDMIICRNVLIYVDRDAQLEIVTKFFNSLKPGGYLVLGRTETLFGDWRKEIDIISTRHRIYQKKLDRMISIDTVKENAETEKSRVDGKKGSEKTRRIKGKVVTDNTTRLEELKNFRKVFDQRKAIWDSRIENQQKASKSTAINQRHRTLQTNPNFRSSLRGSQRKIPPKSTADLKKNSKPDIRVDKLPRKGRLKTRSDKGLLSNYRSMLVKTQNPTKVSTIRKSERQIDELEINYRTTPEEAYRILREKKKLRDARR
ncbi:MAG: CheR family methyltransferase [Candidatus Kariarchaeaceae archaeon]|jgi:chemotaxis protein methyltransferase CheR